MNILKSYDLEQAGLVNLPLSALVHFLTPIDTQLGVQARILGTKGVLFRGGLSQGFSPVAVEEIVAAGAIRTDRWLTPYRGNILATVKSAPSGSGTLYWGPQEVYGLPNLYARGGVEDQQVREVLRWISRYGGPSKMLSLPDVGVTLSPTRSGLVVKSDLGVTHR